MKGVAVAADYLDVPAWRVQRPVGGEALEVQKKDQGNQSRDEHESRRVLLVTDQRNHVSWRVERD